MFKAFTFATSLYPFIFVFGLSCVSPVQRQAGEFFAREPQKREAFRVFIAKDTYHVQQVQYTDQIQRSEDPNGDEEKKKFFTKEHDKLSFSDFTFEGTLQVSIHSSSGQPLNIQYVRGRTPRTWQAGKHFIQDLARFRFEFPDKNRKLVYFHVRYFWNIVADKAFTESGRKQKAIEYLRRQK